MDSEGLCVSNATAARMVYAESVGAVSLLSGTQHAMDGMYSSFVAEMCQYCVSHDEAQLILRTAAVDSERCQALR